MKNAIATLGLSAMIAAAPLATIASADDRAPTTAERSNLTRVLNDAGFKSWRKIERDDGKWEIEDAVHQDGRVFDVEIRGSKIVEMDLED